MKKNFIILGIIFILATVARGTDYLSLTQEWHCIFWFWSGIIAGMLSAMALNPKQE